MQNHKAICLAAAVIMSLFIAPAIAMTAPMPVLVSIPPQKYILERICGDTIAVSVLLKPGTDPHSYEPGPAQMRDASRAAAWFTIGVPFEDAWLTRIKGATAGKLKIISFIRGVNRLPFAKPIRTMPDLHNMLVEHGKHKGMDQRHDFQLPEATEIFHADPQPTADNKEKDKHDDGHTRHNEDPHIWLSPVAVRAMLPMLADELAALMPDKADIFYSNMKIFDAELEDLDLELKERFSPVTPLKRIFLSFHPSWSYFAHNYQLIDISIEVDGKEPGPRTLKSITNMATKLGIKTIFIEPQFPKTAAMTIADAIGATVVTANPLEEDLIALYRSMAEKLLRAFDHE